MITELEQAIARLKRAVSRKVEATTRNVASAETRRFHEREVREATKKVYRVIGRKKHGR